LSSKAVDIMSEMDGQKSIYKIVIFLHISLTARKHIIRDLRCSDER